MDPGRFQVQCSRHTTAALSLLGGGLIDHIASELFSLKIVSVKQVCMLSLARTASSV
jgi:hypothetical protein